MSEYEKVEWDSLLKEKRLNFILSAEQLIRLAEKLGNKIDPDGFILDQEGKRMFSVDAAEIRADDLAAILPGSELLLRKNVASFSQYLAEHPL